MYALFADQRVKKLSQVRFMVSLKLQFPRELSFWIIYFLFLPNASGHTQNNLLDIIFQSALFLTTLKNVFMWFMCVFECVCAHMYGLNDNYLSTSKTIGWEDIRFLLQG